MNKEDIQKLMEAYQSVVSEKSVSQQQQKLMGLALAYKRGEVSADKISPEAKAMADKMSEKDLEDFAKTKHKGLPVTKEEVELEEASDKYMVKYTGPDKSGRTSGPFSKAAAEKKAAMGNKADKVGGKYEVLRYVESVEESLNEELWKEIEAYAKKHGGIDKKDMMKVAMMLKKGDRKGAVKYARGLDTDPRDWLLDKMDESFEQDLESLDEKSCGKDRMKKESDDEDKKMDPVNKKALKKDFDDRDDKDIDNDGDVDGSDEYLHNRRKAVNKAMSKDKKDGKTAEISKIGEAFEELWSALSEAANPKKGATPPEEMDSKDSPKAKEFKKQHSVDVEDEEKTHQTATDAGRATKPAAARPGDNKAGDKNIVNPVKGAVKEDTRTYQQKIMDILSGKTWGEIANEVEEAKDQGE